MIKINKLRQRNFFFVNKNKKAENFCLNLIQSVANSFFFITEVIKLYEYYLHLKFTKIQDNASF